MIWRLETITEHSGQLIYLSKHIPEPPLWAGFLNITTFAKYYPPKSITIDLPKTQNLLHRWIRPIRWVVFTTRLFYEILSTKGHASMFQKRQSMNSKNTKSQKISPWEYQIHKRQNKIIANNWTKTSLLPWPGILLYWLRDLSVYLYWWEEQIKKCRTVFQKPQSNNR